MWPFLFYSWSKLQRKDTNVSGTVITVERFIKYLVSYYETSSKPSLKTVCVNQCYSGEEQQILLVTDE